ncbi:hypothetical protein GCM10009547_27590 [Sporichthya brevicatena]|uniref:Uncharacterized protein n=1 Tax=Sporichthya brevicatena TaxID=171442 RepID=A0ABN1GXT6_9ACTN
MPLFGRPHVSSRYRQQPGRTAALLLLAVTFCVTALFAGGAFDSEVDLSEGSTAILSPEEAAAQAAADDDGGNTALLALLGLLLLVGGVLLLQFALPSRRERRRLARETRTGAPEPPPVVAGPEPVGVRRRMPYADSDPTLVLTPIAPPPAPAPPLCRCGAPIHEPLVLIDPACPPAPPPAPTPTPEPVPAPVAVPVPVSVPVAVPVSENPVPVPTTPPTPAPALRRVGARIGHTASVRMSAVAPVSTPR